MSTRIVSSGDFNATYSFLDKMAKMEIPHRVEALAVEGVNALSSATPSDTGETSASWGYEIEQVGEQFVIWWTNSNTIDGFNVAIGLQYGHGTGTGGWVQGYDYINPAMRPIFDKIADKAWEEVRRS